MNIAIYQYHRQDTHSQDMNQSSEHLILSAVSLCKEKAAELYHGAFLHMHKGNIEQSRKDVRRRR